MKRQLLFICSGLVVASAILGISLLKTADVRAASFAGPQSSHKRFYLGKEVKPDHVLYPFIAATDHARLLIASTDRKVVLTELYTQKRLGFAQYLMDQSEPEMAVMTLQRAHNFQLQMVEVLLAQEDHSQITQALQLLQDQRNYCVKIQEILPSEYSPVLETMIQENAAVQEKLKAAI